MAQIRPSLINRLQRTYLKAKQFIRPHQERPVLLLASSFFLLLSYPPLLVIGITHILSFEIKKLSQFFFSLSFSKIQERNNQSIDIGRPVAAHVPLSFKAQMEARLLVFFHMIC